MALSRITAQGYDYPMRVVNPFWETEEGEGGDYEELSNKPSINGVTLIGDKTSDELDIDEAEELTEEQVNNLVEVL